MSIADRLRQIRELCSDDEFECEFNGPLERHSILTWAESHQWVLPDDYIEFLMITG